MTLCAAAALPAGCGTPIAEPPALRAEILQLRADRSADRVQLRLANDGDEDLDLTGAALTGPLLGGSVEWQKAPGTVRAGSVVDLPFVLSELSCVDEAPQVSASISYRLAGVPGRMDLTPADPLAALESLGALACGRADVTRVAHLEATAVSVVGEGADSVALLTVSIEPTGAKGRLSVAEIRSTVLLVPLEGQAWPVGLQVDAGTPATATTLTVLPRRCDAHALAEDKLGTLFPVVLTVNGREVPYTLPLAPGVKDDLLGFVSQHCGLGAE